jgi:hypothetical protein
VTTSPSENIKELSRFVDRLESGVLTHSPEELTRAQEIVDSLDASPHAPRPETLARFTCAGPGDDS